MTFRWWIVVGAPWFVAAPGCSQSSPPAQPSGPALTVTAGTNPPVGAGLTSTGVSMAAGTAMELVLDPLDGDASVTAQAEDSTFVVVAPMTVPDQVAVIAVAPGNTFVRFFLDGVETTSLSLNGTPASTFSLSVVPQVAPP
jgi:hypothetical protein